MSSDGPPFLARADWNSIGSSAVSWEYLAGANLEYNYNPPEGQRNALFVNSGEMVLRKALTPANYLSTGSAAVSNKTVRTLASKIR